MSFLVMTMHQIFQKEIDEQGRVLLPREWRERVKVKKIVIVMEDQSLHLLPSSRKLASFFNQAKPSGLKPDPFEDYERSLAEASWQ